MCFTFHFQISYTSKYWSNIEICTNLSLSVDLGKKERWLQMGCFHIWMWIDATKLVPSLNFGFRCTPFDIIKLLSRCKNSISGFFRLIVKIRYIKKCQWMIHDIWGTEIKRLGVYPTNSKILFQKMYFPCSMHTWKVYCYNRNFLLMYTFYEP